MSSVQAAPQHVNRIIDKLGKVKRSGSRYMALCPCHDDRNPSLEVNWNERKAWIKCHAGCDDKAVLAALGLGIRDLYPASGHGKQPRQVTSIHDYKDESGALLFHKYRYSDGKQLCRRPDGTWNIQGVRRVLYRLPELLTSGDKTVLLVEGEKDVDRCAGPSRVALHLEGRIDRQDMAFN